MRIPADKKNDDKLAAGMPVQLAAGAKGKKLTDNRPIQKKSNKTGLPDNLKSGIENLSGHSLDDVKVYYNSARPAQLNAHAFAQGNNIHLAPGQEKHLPHEAWHVIQQKQGRAKPTLQMKGIDVNDNEATEHEADEMGSQANEHEETEHDTEEPSEEQIQLKAIHTGRNVHQLMQPAGLIQLAKQKGPKALRYRSLGKRKREKLVTGFKAEQKNLYRGRVHHVRHIIPHSDLQAWIHKAREKGNANSNAGLMRRQIHALLITFGYAADATQWLNDYTAYEAGAMAQSFLQEYNNTVTRVWDKIEWSKRNTFWGLGGINTAIQNRFDAGNGGGTKTAALYNIWHAANSILGLAPTPIAKTRIYSTSLQSYIKVKTAQHNNSRPLQAATGRIQRSDYRKVVSYKRFF